MAHARCQGLQAITHVRITGQAIDDFNDFHQWHRVEEMKSGHPFGTPTFPRDAGD